MTHLPIALDAMGGDHMPEAAVLGARQAHERGIPVVLVGDAERLAPLLAAGGPELPVEHAGDVIRMGDDATQVRRRKDSSVMRCMALVKEGRASAAVSMGHSGATMAAALLSLGRLRGVERPAIVTTIPSERGPVALLDAGANADCRPVHLQQFAVMGSIYARVFLDRADPTVGLVSIGEEPEKGNELTLAAHRLLKETAGVRFHGNVEGRDLLAGTTDVFVTDGFTGNVMLKLAEGEARVLFGWVRDALASGPWHVRLGALLVRPALRSLRSRMDPHSIGAQPLLGVGGNVFIGHGSADATAVLNGLATAWRAVSANLTDRLGAALLELAASADPVEEARREPT